jgi:hypothetical protein
LLGVFIAFILAGLVFQRPLGNRRVAPRPRGASLYETEGDVKDTE